MGSEKEKGLGREEVTCTPLFFFFFFLFCLLGWLALSRCFVLSAGWVVIVSSFSYIPIPLPWAVVPFWRFSIAIDIRLYLAE
ncbi:hypothetical protein B0T17DRAFT_518862 [Bombardia bombarda]|uniref:Transmembrane protein n=1 Tax=Bombardia bombarda TaxID=252184 RepID=A0AA40CF87_9PEZI|nr:hypothetical protein B0T17DRAFT_518862 [Bombardia bombarda]